MTRTLWVVMEILASGKEKLSNTYLTEEDAILRVSQLASAKRNSKYYSFEQEIIVDKKEKI